MKPLADRPAGATPPSRLARLFPPGIVPPGIVPPGIDARSYAVVAAASIGQVATILLTWPLWHPRTSPPNLPLLDPLAAVPWSAPLLAAAALTLVRPRAGGPAFGAVLLLAVLGDQTRLQPEVVSLALLMVAPAFGPQGRTVARWHLASMWLWAGLHKVLSLGWGTGGAAFIASSLGSDGWRPAVAVLLPAAEIGLGVLAFSRRTWPVAAWGGLVLHGAILFTLAALAGWNSAVWPWNAALALSAPMLFGRREREAARVPAVTMAAVLVVSPALFYAGMVDAYLSHNVYTSNIARAAVCPRAGTDLCLPTQFGTWEHLNVPLPPEPRLFRQSFATTCEPGTVLRITGRATRLDDPPSVTDFVCPRRTGVAARA